MKKLLTLVALSSILACNNAADSAESTTPSPTPDTSYRSVPPPMPPPGASDSAAPKPDSSATQADSLKVKKAMKK